MSVTGNSIILSGKEFNGSEVLLNCHLLTSGGYYKFTDNVKSGWFTVSYTHVGYITITGGPELIDSTYNIYLYGKSSYGLISSGGQYIPLELTGRNSLSYKYESSSSPSTLVTYNYDGVGATASASSVALKEGSILNYSLGSHATASSNTFLICYGIIISKQNIE